MKRAGILFILALFTSLFLGPPILRAQDAQGEWVKSTALLSSELLVEGTYRVLISYEIPKGLAHKAGLKSPVTHYRMSRHPINKMVDVEYKKDEPGVFRCIEKHCLQDAPKDWIKATALLSSELLVEGTYRVLISYEVPKGVAHKLGLKSPIIHYRTSRYPINKMVAIEYKKNEPLIFHCIEKNCLE